MKITKRQLRKIIREAATIPGDEPRFQNAGEQYLDDMAMQGGEFQGSMMDLDDHNELVIQIERIVNLFEKRGYTMEDVVHAISNTLGEFK